MTRSEVYALVDLERARQARQWAEIHDWGKGDCSSELVAPITKIAVLAEELGEVARAVLDWNTDHNLRTELVQLTAVAVAWLEGMQ